MAEVLEEKVNILIVDDRPEKLLTYEVMLAELNENIVRANSGREALRWLLRKDFAVILLDVNMPGMDGFETAALIRQRPRSETTPIIFVSAVNDNVKYIARGYSLGAVDYMLTPVVPEILRAKVGVFVDLFRKTEQVKRQAEERAKLIREQAARAETEAQQKRFAFLADASKMLALSLDSQETFQTLARLIVPRLADFCIINIAADGELQNVALAPEEEPRLRQLRDRYASSTAAWRIATRVFESEKPEICPEGDENGLNDLFEDAQDCDRLRAMLSHELRTPLTPVLASVSALEGEEQIPPVLHDSLQLIRRNVELEARLIDDLLDLTRISKGKLQLSCETVDAHQLLQNALEICRSEIESKNLQFTADFSAAQVRLEADPARLQQIFWNLIKNAVKFTPGGGKLSVRTSNDSAGEFCVEVEDSGRGIDLHLLPRVFNAFEQGERAQLGGLGLGLAISKALVDAHHGRITADSAGRDQGAKFTVAFPLSEAGESNRATAPPTRSSVRKAKRILLVEDHEDTNRSLTTLLRQRGYQVDPAYDLRTALDLAANREFDVLISDIGLPDGSGIDLMSRLHHRGPLFGIALTGFGMEEDIRRSYDVGFSHHLVKPVDLNKLDSLIQQGAPEHSTVANPAT